MTVQTLFYTMDNKDGVDLNNVQSSISVTTDPSVPAPRAKLGDRVQGCNGSEWMFVQASATVTCFNVVAIDSNSQARNITATLLASNAYAYGIAEVQPNQMGATVSIGNANGGVVNAGDYFWAAMKITNGGQVNVLTTAALGAKLYIGLLPGTLTSTGPTTATASAPWMMGIVNIELLATISVPEPAEFIGMGYIIPFVSAASV